MPPPTSPNYETPVQPRGLMPKALSDQDHDNGKSREGSCKLFGIPLISKIVASEPPISRTNASNKAVANVEAALNQVHAIASDRKCENLSTSNVLEKAFQLGQPRTREFQSNSSSASARSCTKVLMQGTALGRSLDLTKFNNYDELIAELDQLFEFGGELISPKKNWLVVYTDDEGDMMLVGDDPWQEFCAMVRKIGIYTREEVQKMKPGSLCSKGDDHPVSAEGLDAKEVKCPSASSAENCSASV